MNEYHIRREMEAEGYEDEEIEAAVDRYWDNQSDKYEASKNEREEIWP